MLQAYERDKLQAYKLGLGQLHQISIRDTKTLEWFWYFPMYHDSLLNQFWA